MKILLRLSVLLTFVTIVAACAGSMLPLSVAVGEICKQKAGTMITAEGYLNLPVNSLRCIDGQCQISLNDASNGVSVRFVASATPEPGKLTMPPKQYTRNDLHVTLADGSSADHATRLRLTGPVHTAPKTCYLEAYTAERP